MPLNETSGNLTTDAFGGGVAVVPTYIEDVFSTWLYTGNGSTQTITNGIDLSTKGGLVWIKNRSRAGISHDLYDTIRGVNKYISSDVTYAQNWAGSPTDLLTAFGTTGFTLGADASNWSVNKSGDTYASWTFRKQPKFFDVVTYTGNGTSQNIAHNLGSVPGCIITKGVSGADAWYTYHRSLTNRQALVLNTTAAVVNNVDLWNSTTPTSTQFSVGPSANNNNGSTYVAYLFAHDAGGFGLTGTDNVISCGSYVGNGLTAGPQVTLGFEPQFVIRKNITSATRDITGWTLNDTMRSMSQTTDYFLKANTSAAEDTTTVTTGFIIPNATGFVDTYTYPDDTYIYIAIRRGPMKVPTDATTVFSPYTRAGTDAAVTVTGVGFSPDLVIANSRTAGYLSWFYDRLRGTSGGYLIPSSTGAEGGDSTTFITISGIQDGYALPVSNPNRSIATAGYVDWRFKRAPSFFDEVVTTADSSGNLSFTHNLGVTPELVIMKSRTGSVGWYVYSANVTHPTNTYMRLNVNNAAADFYPTYTYYAPTSTTFTTYQGGWTANNASTVVYLFATCPGVSKCGSYTGNGTTQTINCGFTGGARFVLIKRTDSTGDWYVYDTARGMTTLTDPYLLLNSSTGDTATLGSVTTATTGFALNESILSGINTSSATYIFLAIA